MLTLTNPYTPYIKNQLGISSKVQVSVTYTLSLPPKKALSLSTWVPKQCEFCNSRPASNHPSSCTFSCSSDGGKAKGKKVNKASPSVTVIINKKNKAGWQGKARHGARVGPRNNQSSLTLTLTKLSFCLVSFSLQ